MAWIGGVVPVIMFAGVLYLLWRLNVRMEHILREQQAALLAERERLAKQFATIDRGLELALGRNSQLVQQRREQADMESLSARTREPWPQ